jgi:hypothetical protein
MNQTYPIHGTISIDTDAQTFMITGSLGLNVPDPPVPPTSGDMIDLSQALIVNAPDVQNWPQTARITALTFDGSTSRVFFTKQDGDGRWPDVRPSGWTGDLQYTWWLFKHINGQWVGSAFIQMWYGRDGSGTPADPDVPSKYDAHWYYSSRWAPIHGSGQIQPGEVIGMMVTSGNQRDSVGPDSVQERSNVVTFAAADVGAFSFV